MLTRRIIPCLDVRQGRVVKGKKFSDLKDVEDPAFMAKRYSLEGADELVFYDITASSDERKISLEFVEKVAREINIPFCVGGGVETIDDFQAILRKGADKISINSGAVKNPELITLAANKYGSQCVVLSIDAKKNEEGSWSVYVKGGREKTKLDAIEWAVEGVRRGAGELVINSVDEDGMLSGYDIDLLKKITSAVNVPVIASGGAGAYEHFEKAILEANIDGVLAASVFHYETIKIEELKERLDSKNIAVRKLVKNMKDFNIDELVFNADGLIPVVVQEYETKEVLMLAYMNKEALAISLRDQVATYFSRSRNQLWKKGETSGHVQHIHSIYYDCDQDTLLMKVKQEGVACHTNHMSCFFSELTKHDLEPTNRFILDELYAIISERKLNPQEGSYTNYLFTKGIDKILKKVGEEAAEVIIASKIIVLMR